MSIVYAVRADSAQAPPTRAAEQIEPTFEENLPAAMEVIKRIL